MWYVLFTRFQYLVVKPLIVTKANGHLALYSPGTFYEEHITLYGLK